MNKIQISYNNDIYFKHLLSCDDNISQLLRKVIISDEFNIKYNNLRVVNPIINTNHLDEKTTILDILLQTESKEYINLEMQVSSIREFEYKRFQFYGANMLSMQLHKGESYDKLQKNYQIIFCTNRLNFDSLYAIYTSKDSFNNEEPYNLIHRIYVNMPYINEIVKNKDFNQLNDFEKMVLIFQNNLQNGIMKYEKEAINMMDDPIVKAMKDKMDELNQDIVLRAYALSREMGRAQYIHNEEMLKKMQEEIEVQRVEIEVQREEIEVKEKELETKQEKMIKFISEKFNCSMQEAEEQLKNM